MNKIGTYTGGGNVRNGSLAALLADISVMAASGGKPDVSHTIFDGKFLNVRFSQ